MTAQIRKVLWGLTMIGGLMFASGWAQAFDSGSDGSDGIFNPGADVEIQVPDNGKFNYITVDIPDTVTVTYTPNPANTPLTILASGNVTVAGTIDVSGVNGGTAESGPISSYAGFIPGGPGGYAGGRGGISGAATPPEEAGGNGLGPGGGSGGITRGCAGKGAGFGFVGTSLAPNCNGAPDGGPTYGSTRLLPLIGGSGGGGGGGSVSGQPGGGGGGGGGAILIASSGTVDITGSIVANGGNGGDFVNSAGGAAGGSGGSGGAIRIVATAMSGDGSILALGGQGGDGKSGFSSNDDGGNGGKGRIRLEADDPIAFSGSVDPFPSVGQPQALIIPGVPTLRIASIAGTAVPPTPSGSDDVVLGSDTTSPMTVQLESTDVPLGKEITLTVIPDTGASFSTLSTPIGGSEANGTADATVALPSGHSVLSATVSFTVTAALGDAMKHFAQGERVERIVLAAGLGQASQTTFVTVSGKEYTWPSNIVAAN